jgi:hypothetical protein
VPLPVNLLARGAALVAAVSRPRRLFNKNTGLREPARGSMGADACPVPEG